MVFLGNTAALLASVGLGYISLYIMRDVCMVCVSMYGVSIVMFMSSWNGHKAAAAAAAAKKPKSA